MQKNTYTDGVIFTGRVPGFFCEETIRAQSFSMPTRHLHDALELYFLYSGERFYFVDQDTYHLNDHTAILIDKQQIHKTSPAGTASCHRFLLQMDTEKAAPYLKLLGFSDPSEFGNTYRGLTQFTDEEWAGIDMLLNSLKSEFSKTTAVSESLIYLTFLQLFMLFAESRSNYGNKKWKELDSSSRVDTGMYHKVHEIALYLQNHYQEPLSLDDLAKRFFISRSYMSRIFKSVTTFTILEYQTHVRIKKACLLLSDTDLPVTEISDQTGFGNVTYFERVFRKTMAMTPLSFRNKPSRQHRKA